MNISNSECANGWSQCLEGAPRYLGYLEPEPIIVEIPWNLQDPKQLWQKHLDCSDSRNPQFEIPTKTKKRL